MSASSLSLPIFLRINFLISYLIVTDSQNTFDWHTQKALLNDKKAGCTSRALSILVVTYRTWRLAVNFDWLHIWFRAGQRWWRSPSVSTQLDVPGGETSLWRFNIKSPLLPQNNASSCPLTLKSTNTFVQNCFGQFTTFSLKKAILCIEDLLEAAWSENDWFVTNMQIFASRDFNWWTGDVWHTCGLWWCFYQKFWHRRHPLMSKWCNAKLLKINLLWWRNKLIYILDSLGVSTFSANL